MLEIPNLNTVYEDEVCSCVLHDVKGDGTLLVFHADVLPVAKKSLLSHYLDVVESIDQALQERGLKELECWVCSDEEIKYAGFFGFTEMLGELLVNKQHCFPAVYRLRKTF